MAVLAALLVAVVAVIHVYVNGQGVYASKGKHDVRNASDGIYQQSQGMTLLDVVKDGGAYKATFEIAIQRT